MPKDEPDAVLTRMLKEKPMTKAEIRAMLTAQCAAKKGARSVN
jgi:precorrin-6B methylase 2